jgi:lipopolysaccharide biosynthesis glycosyltransferase
MPILIEIPKNIKDNLSIINSITLQFLNDCSVVLSEIPVSNKHAAAVEFVIVHPTDYNKSSSIAYVFTTTSNITTQIKYNNKETAIYTQKIAHKECLRINKSELYENSFEGKEECIRHIEQLFQESNSLDSTPCKGKNLIYYSVYFNNGYVELFELSLQTILKYSKLKNIDFLVITDVATQELIKKTDVYKNVNINFLITDTPVDGVEASKNKCLIYNYEKIDNYKKILFLDTDIVCMGDMNNVFNKNIQPNIIYSARPSTSTYNTHKSIYHGLSFYTDEDIIYLTDNKQLPFNAGQFLFVNSKSMRNHFNNLVWFMKNWPGEYFFEQSFMNVYFCKNKAADFEGINENVAVLNTVIDLKHNITKKTCLIHFTAPPLDASKKLKFIKDYMKKKKTNKISRIINFLKEI